MPRDRGFGPQARLGGDGLETLRRDLKRVRGRAQPCGSPLGPKREWRGNMPRAALLERARCVPQERLRQKEDGVWTNRQIGVGPAHREEMHGADAERVKQTRKLILDDIRKRPDNHQVRPRIRAFVRKGRDERSETRVLALREGRLDPAAGVGQHADRGGMDRRLSGRGAFEIDLDDFRWTGADEEQKLDVRPPFDETSDDPVELVVDVRDPRQIALAEDRRGKARLGKDHNASGRLNQMGAGSRSDDEEERVLNFAVQPDDAGQPAEDLPLSSLPQHRRGLAPLLELPMLDVQGNPHVHDAGSS